MKSLYLGLSSIALILLWLTVTFLRAAPNVTLSKITVLGTIAFGIWGIVTAIRSRKEPTALRVTGLILGLFSISAGALLSFLLWISHYWERFYI